MFSLRNLEKLSGEKVSQIWHNVSDLLGGMAEVKVTLKEILQHRDQQAIPGKMEELTKENHKLEVESVELQSKIKLLQNDKSTLRCSLLKAESLAEDLKREITMLQEDKVTDQREKTHLQDYYKELQCKMLQLRKDQNRLKKAVHEKIRENSQLCESRLILLRHIQHLKKQVQHYSERTSNIHQICSHAGQNVGQIDSHHKDEIQTHNLQLSLKLYRQSRLVECLEERLRLYEPGFSVSSDSLCAPYLDD